MANKHSYFLDDGQSELVKRYESYLTGTYAGYFDIEEMGQIVEYYLLRGKTSESLTAFEFGKKLHPDSNLLDIKRAKIYNATGDFQKALRILNNLVETEDTEVQLLKIETNIKLHNEREAMKIAEELIEADDDDKEMMIMDVAMIFMMNSSFDAALELLKMGEELDASNTDVLYEKAFCYEQLGNSQGAIDTYTRIINIDAYSSEAWFNLGQVYFNQLNYEKAIDAYDYALVINEEDSISLIQKAHALYQLNNFEKAIEIYLEYLLLSSEKWQVYTFIGECYEKLENFIQALNYYSLSLDEMPGNFDALIGVSICYLEMEEYATSLEYIHKALDIDDKAADVWVYLAEANIGLNNIDLALDAYLNSIILEASQPDTLMAIASIYMDKSDFENAVKYYELAYSFDTNLELIELFMAVAYYYFSDETKMKYFLNLAIQKNLDSRKLFQEFCPLVDIDAIL